MTWAKPPEQDDPATFRGVRACYSIPEASSCASTNRRTASEKLGIGEGCRRRHSSTRSTVSDVKPISFFSGYCSGRGIFTPFHIYHILTTRSGGVYTIYTNRNEPQHWSLK